MNKDIATIKKNSFEEIQAPLQPVLDINSPVLRCQEECLICLKNDA